MKPVLRAKKWTHNYSRLSLSDDLLFLCLPEWFVYVLLDATERMLWSNVWQDADGSYPPLTREQLDKIAYAIYLLSLMECDMNITVNPVITNTIEGCGCGGCGGSGSTGCNYPPGTPVPGVPVNWPIPADDNPIPPVPDIPPPGTELDPVRCRLANWWWSVMRLHMTTLRDYTLGLQGATTILLGIIAILPAGLVARIGSAVLMAIANAIVQLRGYLEMAELLFDPAIEWWDDNQQDIVCYVYNGTNQDAISEYIQGQLFERLEEFWANLGTNSLLQDLLWGLWRWTFVRDSLFGLALNGVVPETWHPSHPVIDCAICGGGGGFPEPPTGSLLYVFTPPVTIVETVENAYTTSFEVEPDREDYAYTASWPTNATWNPILQIVGEPELPGDTFVGIVVRVASLSVTGGSDPSGERVRLGLQIWDNALDANLEEGHGMAWIGTEYATDFVSWAETYQFTLQSLNLLTSSETEELSHYRRSGVLTEPGTLAGRFEVRFVYAREIT